MKLVKQARFGVSYKIMDHRRRIRRGLTKSAKMFYLEELQLAITARSQTAGRGTKKEAGLEVF